LGLVLFCKKCLAGGLEELEFPKGAVETALDLGLVARQVAEGVQANKILAHGVGQATGLAPVQLVVANLGQASFEGPGLNPMRALELPGGDGHLPDEQGLDGAGGLAVVEKGGGKGN